MKWAASLKPILVVSLLTVLTAPVSLAQEKEFCWKDSYGRGVGTVPTSCAPGQDMIGVFCYDKCPANMARFGFDCHSVCPEGFRDDGLFCRRAEYGRGAGYSWWWSDGWSSEGMLNRCKADNPTGCEMSGAIAYPKCQPGYNAFGCCICRPDVPDCTKLGLGGNLDLSCAKKVGIGQPKLGVCPGGVMDAGLCYGGCQAGYYGVGPVCWSAAPKSPPAEKDWVDCGMGAAKDSMTCASIIFNQVAAVGQLAMTAATLGSSMAGNAGSSVATNAGKLAELKALYAKLKDGYDAAKKAYPAIQTAEKAYEVGSDLNKLRTAINTLNTAADTAQNREALAEDITRVAAQIAALVDSSGVSATVAAYTYPKCSRYFEPPK